MPPSLRSLPLLLMLLALAGCKRPVEQVVAYSSDASSRTGLLPLADGVLLGNEAGALLRLRADGTVLWRAMLGREVAARPAVSGGHVLAGTVGGDLVCVDLQTGAERWRLTGQPPVLADLAADEGAVYVMAPDGSVRAHAVDTGALRWRRPGLPPQVAARLPPPLTPVLGAGTLVLVQGNKVLGLSAQDGAERWREAKGEVVGLTGDGQSVFLSTRTGGLLRLRPADGSTVWEVSPAVGATSAPSLAGGRVWMGAPPSELVGVKLEDGSLAWKSHLPAPLSGGVAVLGDTVLVPLQGPEGLLLGLQQPGEDPVFEQRLDTRLLSAPAVLGDTALVLGRDGRVLGYRLRRD
ncbi:PQQ-binding-like beta-propeller repeat protein [Aggregicoccus sp. 17bor-14]|uniref:PQQ-like beta-propeller repeat protein n=1 Tax=Myxococcaceae TaxID=31 RepID=UPI00129CB2BA|nr:MULTISPECIES: PQQ-like beta-propeller repeat protein [Myxococcaceae]MBF5043827.1 PQQ-binding-like beta-propeller repeat protein [Simulacricoccus sp. 17bor-14]MRI89579.1 PQQ-binding-like beta-propeller repeat protein [Aggregicoccus sp. 17bor-14]